MRNKNFLFLLCSVILISLMLVIFGPQKPDSFQNIVTTTHQHIRKFQDNLKDAEEKNLVTDEKYLKLLGFVDKPRLYPNNTWHNTSLPIVATYLFDGQESLVVGLMNNVARVLPNNTLLVYHFGLGSYSLQNLLNYCNSSRCQVVLYSLDEFPSHVEEDRLHAYRPLIIQDALNKAGAVLFLENNQRLMPRTTAQKYQRLFSTTANTSSILTWPMKKAVSSLTHKKMFEYFHTDADNYLFLQMVDAKRLLLFNTDLIHRQIMLPWVQCALTRDCVHPIGAQSAGCKFDKKPQYRYSGCHSYDVSALNIVLGLRFHLDSTQYTYRGTDRLFSETTLDTAIMELAEIERNATDSKPVSVESSSVH